MTPCSSVLKDLGGLPRRQAFRLYGEFVPLGLVSRLG